MSATLDPGYTPCLVKPCKDRPPQLPQLPSTLVSPLVLLNPVLTWLAIDHAIFDQVKVQDIIDLEERKKVLVQRILDKFFENRIYDGYVFIKKVHLNFLLGSRTKKSYSQKFCKKTSITKYECFGAMSE